MSAGTEQEQEAIDRLNVYLDSQRASQVPVSGYTYSSPYVPFVGVWWSPEQRRRIEDYVVFYTIDYALTDSRQFKLAIRRLREVLSRAYHEAGAPQEEFWISSNTIVGH